ncbi:hypothetical protein HC031_02420 [Planosporangium thailandense]|uniref:LppX_LprAFG lipoprotein n=1 Tax=Planosporangium thailandense TaxID=765197 RepID=A0ABX0XS25_9ACTN|nr:hypothetical protein [Planosporangium thailandense]NJC68583.1 hypothetical protein [Planosporangium thailandense]
MRSRTIGTLALGLSGVLFLTGCAGNGTGRTSAPAATSTGTATPSPTGPSAKDDLVAALTRTGAAPYRYAAQSDLPESGSLSVTGAFDPVGKRFEATTTVTGGTLAGTHHRVVVGADSYLREGDTKTWVHLDLSRVKKDNPLLRFDMTDPTGLAKFSSTLGNVDRTGPHAYSGSFDPLSSEPFLPIGAPSLVAFAGMAPFTATTDDQNRVVSIHIELPRSDGPKLVMTTTLSDHGNPLPIQAPPKASVAEADDFNYR